MKKGGEKNNGTSKEVGSRRRGTGLGGIHLDRAPRGIDFLGCGQASKRRWCVVDFLGLSY